MYGAYSVESTEIDLTEFQEENQEEVDVEPQIADADADSNNNQPGCLPEVCVLSHTLNSRFQPIYHLDLIVLYLLTVDNISQYVDMHEVVGIVPKVGC
ncbi:unnamed protein product [Lactuca saligna]|uniref:Uncharacterized protein n=1 Tax=Lactuca saligna TaxID=75948 RepID=A0AA35UV64_LACSI|nr:unnamed protein product [Lactuca saligna]